MERKTVKILIFGTGKYYQNRKKSFQDVEVIGFLDNSESKIGYKLDGKKIFLTIPEAEILGNEIVKQEVFDESSSIFKPRTTKEVFEEIKKSQDETCEDLIAEGLLDESRNYAINILTQFMHSIGFEEVIIK